MLTKSKIFLVEFWTLVTQKAQRIWSVKTKTSSLESKEQCEDKGALAEQRRGWPVEGKELSLLWLRSWDLANRLRWSLLSVILMEWLTLRIVDSLDSKRTQYFPHLQLDIPFVLLVFLFSGLFFVGWGLNPDLTHRSQHSPSEAYPSEFSSSFSSFPSFQAKQWMVSDYKMFSGDFTLKL